MTSQNLTDNAKIVYGDLGRWGVCVGSYPDMTAEDIATDMKYRGRNMRVSTIGELRAAGFDVIPDPEEGPVHALVTLPEPPSEAQWEHLRSCFGPRQPNPVYQVPGGP